MSDKKQGNAAMSTSSTDKGVPGNSLSHVSTSNLTPRILSEQNYTADTPPKRSLRQLILSIHARTSPKASQKLPNEELSRLIRYGDLLQRRLLRLVPSVRRFIDLKPMLPLQEAIAQELAQQFGCQTRIFNRPNEGRYMVIYKPGMEPHPFELRARRMCQKDKGQEIYVRREDIEDVRMEPMFFRDGLLHWHQPMEWGERQKAAEPVLSSLSLGRQILVTVTTKRN